MLYVRAGIFEMIIFIIIMLHCEMLLVWACRGECENNVVTGCNMCDNILSIKLKGTKKNSMCQLVLSK